MRFQMILHIMNHNKVLTPRCHLNLGLKTLNFQKSSLTVEIKTQMYFLSLFGTMEIAMPKILLLCLNSPQNLKISKREVSFPEINDMSTIPKEGGSTTERINISGSAKLSNGSAEIKSYVVYSNFRRIYPIKPFKFKTRKKATPKLELREWEVKSEATDKQKSTCRRSLD